MNNVSVSRKFAVALRAQLRVLADKDPSIFGTGTSDDCAPWPIIEEFIHDLTQALAQPSEQPAQDAMFFAAKDERGPHYIIDAVQFRLLADLCGMSVGVLQRHLSEDSVPAKAEQPGDAIEDAILLGRGFVKDGKRIDPRDVYERPGDVATVQVGNMSPQKLAIPGLGKIQYASTLSLPGVRDRKIPAGVRLTDGCTEVVAKADAFPLNSRPGAPAVNPSANWPRILSAGTDARYQSVTFYMERVPSSEELDAMWLHMLLIAPPAPPANDANDEAVRLLRDVRIFGYAETDEGLRKKALLHIRIHNYLKQFEDEDYLEVPGFLRASQQEGKE
jgi:hypothetical protein